MCERNWKRPTKGATHGDGRLHHQTNGRVHREVQHTQVILKTLITYTPSSWPAVRRFLVTIGSDQEARSFAQLRRSLLPLTRADPCV